MNISPKMKNIILAIAIPVSGYLLLVMTFILDFLYQSIFNRIFMLITGGGNMDNMNLRWIPMFRHFSFAVIIVLVSLLILRSKKITEPIKAIITVVPTAVVLVTTFILLYTWPVAGYASCALIYCLTILYLYKTKRSWMFYYAVSIVALLLLIVGILGIDI